MIPSKPRLFLATLVGAAAMSPTSTAVADSSPQQIASQPVNPNPPSVAPKVAAFGSYAAWSVIDRATGRYALMIYDGKQLRRVRGRERRVPFDGDLGTDARGRVKAVYSRCATDPAAVFGAPFGRRCRLYMADAVTRTERRLTIAHPASASDTQPTLWRGKLAFSRAYPEVTPRRRVELLLARSTRDTRPTKIATIPVGIQGTGTATTLDLRGVRLAYTASYVPSSRRCATSYERRGGGNPTVSQVRLVNLATHTNRVVESGCDFDPVVEVRSAFLGAGALFYVRQDRTAAPDANGGVPPQLRRVGLSGGTSGDMRLDQHLAWIAEADGTTYSVLASGDKKQWLLTVTPG